MDQLVIDTLILTDKEIHGIRFHNETLINLIINGTAIDQFKFFGDGTVYWPELKASAQEAGSYLIFTCHCGIADDAGWEKINVTHTDGKIIWSFNRNGKQTFGFNANAYKDAIRECESRLDLNRYPLAIKDAIFPE